MSQGILMFAHNNGLFDYGKMAYAAACAAYHYIEKPISLVTDRDTWDDLNANYMTGLVFDGAIFVESDARNSRHFYMSDGTTRKAAYHNSTRLRAYELSPYNETLLLDTDLLVQDHSLCGVWNSPFPIMMNRKVSNMVKSDHSSGTSSQVIDGKGMECLWATICYFNKSSEAEELFRTAEYVATNYDYFGVLYGFATNFFRVDFILTIAAHIISGYVDGATVVESLPYDRTVFARDKDIMVDVRPGRATFLVKNDGHEFPVVTRQTVHCMNKDSMLAHADRIIECYA